MMLPLLWLRAVSSWGTRLPANTVRNPRDRNRPIFRPAARVRIVQTDKNAKREVVFLFARLRLARDRNPNARSADMTQSANAPPLRVRTAINAVVTANVKNAAPVKNAAVRGRKSPTAKAAAFVPERRRVRRGSCMMPRRVRANPAMRGKNAVVRAIPSQTDPVFVTVREKNQNVRRATAGIRCSVNANRAKRATTDRAK